MKGAMYVVASPCLVSSMRTDAPASTSPVTASLFMLALANIMFSVRMAVRNPKPIKQYVIQVLQVLNISPNENVDKNRFNVSQ